MISPAALRELFDHNYWARDRQLQVCAALTQEQFLRPLGGDGPPLRDILAHLLAVEWLWLERWQGRSPRAMPPAAEWADLAALTNRWRLVAREMRACLAGLTEEALGRPISYVNFRGEAWTYPLWRVLMHLAIHQSYHRGQVTAALRQLGAQPPAVDFLMAHDMGFRL